MSQVETHTEWTLGWRVAHLVGGRPWAVALSLSVAVVWAANEGCRAFFINRLIDALAARRTALQAFGPGDWAPVVHMLTLWTLMSVLYRAHCWWLAYDTPRIKHRIRRLVFAEMLGHPSLGDGRLPHGQIASYLLEFAPCVENIYRLIAQQLLPITCACIVATCLMAQVGNVFALVFVAWLTVHIGIYAAFRGHSERASRQAAQTCVGLGGEVMDCFLNKAVIKAHDRQDLEANRLDHLSAQACQTEHAALLCTERMKIGQGINALAFVYAIVLRAVSACAQGSLSLGAMYQALGLCVSMVGLAWYSGQHIGDLVTHLGKLRAALAGLHAPPRHAANAPPHGPSGIAEAPAIAMRDVSFAYHETFPVLKDLNLHVEAGEKVALIGGSGGGKSTLMRLLIGGIAPRSGSIAIMGHLVSANASARPWLDCISCVFQEPLLFCRSIADNIRYGRSHASLEAMYTAAHLAQAHAFIVALPQGYDTLVGDRGCCLSVGQKQRIALARAILRDAPVWLFDEPTSALDEATEVALLANLRGALTRRTLLVCTHRPALAGLVSRIVMLKDGRVQDGRIDPASRLLTTSSLREHEHVVR